MDINRYQTSKLYIFRNTDILYSADSQLFGFGLNEPKETYRAQDELNIYVDESGNISTKKESSMYYIIGMVFHEKKNDISKIEDKLEEEFRTLGYPDTCFHCSPIIYGKDKFRYEELEKRRKIMKSFFSFFRHLKIKHKEFAVEKKNLTKEDIGIRLSSMIHEFICNNIIYFTSFSKITIIYDNGQDIVTKILEKVFAEFLSEVIIEKKKPSESRLLQVADLLCTLEWLKIKEKSMGLVYSESSFFRGSRRLNYQYIKIYEDTKFG